jgi:hypothetical protein
MKKDEESDELQPEYDFSQMPGRVRGKYAEAYRKGTNLARLDPDVAAAFTTDSSVNEALRAILRVAPKRSLETPIPADASRGSR